VRIIIIQTGRTSYMPPTRRPSDVMSGQIYRSPESRADLFRGISSFPRPSRPLVRLPAEADFHAAISQGRNVLKWTKIWSGYGRQGPMQNNPVNPTGSLKSSVKGHQKSGHGRLLAGRPTSPSVYTRP
jgi:hypothetical protein